jgi:hypothetical protein
MNSHREKPGLAFWAAVVLVAALAYPLSFGPAFWVSSRCECGIRAVTIFYRPILQLWTSGPRAVGAIVY